MGACPRAELIASRQTEHGLTRLHPGGARGVLALPWAQRGVGGPAVLEQGGTAWGDPALLTTSPSPWWDRGALPSPGHGGLPPATGSEQSSASGQGQPPGAPPAPAWGCIPGSLPVPHNCPGTGHHPSMFEDNFPKGCFYFIACNKAKRPTLCSSALPQGGLDTALTPPPASLPRAAAPPTSRQAHGGQGMGSCPHPCTPWGGGGRKQVR